MAFRFTWPEFDNAFYAEAKSQLEAAMNKGNKPSVIVDHITVKELYMGTKPPELEILEIGELANDKFRGIFKLTYAGDAYIEIQTKVQANPMHAKVSDLPRYSRPSVLAADQPLVVPMVLRISDLKLRGIVVLVVSKQKGVTLVFKNDPLESIRISSTFDSVSILREFLQRQIEEQLRNMLQEDLPDMIHNLSTKYIQSEEKKKEQQERQQKLERQQSLTSTPIMLQRFRSNTSITTLPELDSYSVSPYSISSDSVDSIYMPTLQLDDESDYLSTTTTHYIKNSAPMTAANLFSHNKQYQLGIHPLFFKPTADVQSETEYSLISDIYANDADAPWYATEGPDLNSTCTYNNDCIVDPVTIYPLENRMAAQLSLLTNANHTLSTLPETTISHFTFRSLPHIAKPSTIKCKKTPKRRLTRLNMSAPRL